MEFRISTMEFPSDRRDSIRTVEFAPKIPSQRSVGSRQSWSRADVWIQDDCIRTSPKLDMDELSLFVQEPPDEIDSLVEVDFGNRRLPDDLGMLITPLFLRCPMLRRIHFQGNKFGDLVCEAIAGSLKFLRALQLLDMSNTRATAKGVIALVEAAISDAPFEASPVGVMAKPSDQIFLRFAECKRIADDGCCDIAEILRKKKTKARQEVGLDLRAVSCETPGAVALLCAGTAGHLKRLILADNKAGDLQLAGACIGVNFRELDMSKVKKIEDGNSDFGNMTINQLLHPEEKGAGTLEVLKFDGNGVSYAGKAVANWLSQPNCSLRVLTLGHNAIEPEIAILIFDALKSCKQLIQLDLSHNNLDDSIADSLAGIASSNLEYLSLAGNALIEDQTALAIANVLSEQALELPSSSCAVSSSGVSSSEVQDYVKSHLLQSGSESRSEEQSDVAQEKSSEFLKQPRASALREVDVSWCSISYDGASKLAEVIENPGCQLHVLDVCHTPMRDEGMELLQQAAKARSTKEAISSLGERVAAVIEIKTHQQSVVPHGGGFVLEDSDDEQPADSFDGESENIQERDLSNDWWYDDDDAALDTAKGLKPLPTDDRASQSSSPVSEKAPNRIPAEGYAHSSRSSRLEAPDAEDKKKKSKKWFSPSKIKGSKMAKGVASVSKKAGHNMNKAGHNVKASMSKSKTSSKDKKAKEQPEASSKNPETCDA